MLKKAIRFVPVCKCDGGAELPDTTAEIPDVGDIIEDLVVNGKRGIAGEHVVTSRLFSYHYTYENGGPVTHQRVIIEVACY